MGHETLDSSGNILPRNAPDHVLVPSSQSVVLVCDPIRSRRDKINSLIASAQGARPIEASASLNPSLREYPNAIVIVATGESLSPDNPVLAFIIRCGKAGLPVISYEDGAKGWPLSKKCLPLVAGAVDHLDSNEPEFLFRLHLRLQQLIQASTEKEHTKEAIRGLMCDHDFIGASPAIIGVFESAVRFSQLSDLPVLITGETGTGKELLAKAIFKMDPKRKSGPLIPINCAAISPSLMDDEFFGHRRGAFTGALQDRKGLIRAAEGGVLFLDEVGELDLALQAKLLRVLQENSLKGVGEEREARVSVRFIAATNRSLEQMVAEQKFRADLLYRLNVLKIHIPALRERPMDLPLLVSHFVRKHRGNKLPSRTAATPDFLEALERSNLPGNVRQLENVIRESLLNQETDVDLNLKHLPLYILGQLSTQLPELKPQPDSWTPTPQSLPGEIAAPPPLNFFKEILEGQRWNLCRTLQLCERELVHVTLERTHGNQSQAARILGVSPRSVYNKVRKHHLARHQA
jgi:transcriptional regulator with GAF, ATPase, and Fis domain